MSYLKETGADFFSESNPHLSIIQILGHIIHLDWCVNKKITSMVHESVLSCSTFGHSIAQIDRQLINTSTAF